MIRCASFSRIMESGKTTSNYRAGCQYAGSHQQLSDQTNATALYLRVSQHIIVDAESRLPSSAQLQAGQQNKIETAHHAAEHCSGSHEGCEMDTCWCTSKSWACKLRMLASH